MQNLTLRLSTVEADGEPDDAGAVVVVVIEPKGGGAQAGIGAGEGGRVGDMNPLCD